MDKPQPQQYTVLHLGKFYPPHCGGIETHVHALATRQAKFARVHVIVSNTARQTETSVMDDVKVTRVGRVAQIASMPICPDLTAAIRQSPADLVHMHAPNPGAAVAFLRSGHRGRLIITHHADTMGRKVLRRLSDPFVRRAMERADVIIVTSARYLRSSEELAPFVEKCRVIPLGIDVDSSLKETAAPFADGLPMVLAVGRLVPYKGFDVLIRAMRDVDAKLVLIGTGPERDRLKTLIEREQVGAKVVMPGRVDDLRPYLHAASVFVLPSTTRAEAFGLVQLEAMAVGLPLVNTNIESGVPEISVNGETGFTVEPGAPATLSDAINRLLRDDSLRARFGNAARARVAAEYTADRMAARTAALYEEVLNNL